MPEEKSSGETLLEYRNRFDAIIQEEAKLGKSPNNDAAVNARSEETHRLLIETHRLEKRIVDSAQALFEREDQRYQRYTYLSYALYTLGWGLTLAGRLFSIEGLVATE